MSFIENIERVRQKKIIEADASKTNEKGIVSQQRQEKIALLGDKKQRLGELLFNLQQQYGVAKDTMGEFAKANNEISGILKREEEHPLEHKVFEETTKKELTDAIKEGKYNQIFGEEDNPVEIRNQKAKKLEETIGMPKMPQEGKPKTIVELKKAIKEELPDAKVSFRGKTRETGFAQIKSAIGHIETEIKDLVKEGVVERHKNGSVDLLPEDLKDMEILGKEETKNIILEQAQKPIEEKRLKEIGGLETLKKDLDLIRSLGLGSSSQEARVVNPEAEKLLDTEKQWKKRYQTEKNINHYFGAREENINSVANNEKSLAGRSLDKNFLALKNQEAEGKNGEVYDKVDGYYKIVKELGRIAKQLEAGMGPYNDGFTIGKDQSLIMPALDKAIGEWEKIKADRITEKSGQDGQGGQEGKIKKLSSGFLGKTRHKEEIEVVNKKIQEIDAHIGFLDKGIVDMKKIKENSQKKLGEFFAVIPKEWRDNEKFSQEIFTKHERTPYSGALVNVVSSLEHFPKNFGIISESDLEIFKELGQQRSALQSAAENEKQTKDSLMKAQQKATTLEKEYLS